MTNRYLTTRSLTIAALLASSALAAPALAQQTANPLYRNWDENNYDLVQGDTRLNFEEASIGSGKARLALVRNDVSLFPLTWDHRTLHEDKVGTNPTTYIAQKPDKSYFRFTGSTSDAADGATWTLSSDPVTFNFAIEITDGDGTKYLYSDPVGTDAGPTDFCSGSKAPPCDLLLSQVKYPDGSTITVNNELWYTATTAHEFRVRSVSNNFGYSLNFTYQTATPLRRTQQAGISPPDSWYTHSVTALQRSGVTQASVSYSYPQSGTVDITDPAGHVWELTASSIKKPGDSSPSYSVTASGGVTTIVNDGVTTTYNRSVSGNTVTLTKTDALGKPTVITSDLSIGQITSIKDPLNRTTSYGHDTAGRLTSVTRPEGDGTDYVLDSRGNATQVKQRPKTGSSSPSLVTQQAFSASCGNPLTCNEPTSVTDPRGNTTDYTYDPNSGQVATMTSPAPTAGAVRPQTRYTYTLTGGVYLLTGTSQCATQSSCSGNGDEVKTTIGYDAYGNATSISKGNGTGTLTASETMTYDGMGNLLTVDGPLSGTADTTRYRYDLARRLTGATSPDPDGAGALKNRAIRYTYDGAGRLTKQELGTVASQSDSDWAAFAPLETVDLGLDANGRVVTEKLSGGGTAYALTQIGYDADGRPQCSAVRMNPAVYGSLPASACTLGTQGSYGPDRITKTLYDDAGQVTQVQQALGVSGQAANERTLTYTADGDVQTLKDAENNLTTFEYEDYDRPAKTRYPSAAKGAGTSSTTDYEQYTYDDNSNLYDLRTRSGDTLQYRYDALNRLIVKDSAVLAAIVYTYDNLGRLVTAKYDGSKQGITNDYDALGRLTSSASDMGGTARTLAYGYDLAGRRTSIAYPAASGAPNLTVTYNYLTTGEVSSILDGATSLAAYTYDSLGNRAAVTYGNGVKQTYSYDPVSRLTVLNNDLAGTAYDLSIGTSASPITYNPASEITSVTHSNDAYAWTGAVNVNRGYTSNGLNQYTAAGATSFTYDANGNLTGDGTWAYSYDAENRLTTAVGAGKTANLTYDPLGRLTKIGGNGIGDVSFVEDGGEIAADYVVSTGALYHRYVFGPGVDEPIVEYDGSGNRTWLIADERGSIIARPNATGNASSSRINSYDEYGIPGATNTGRFQYTGQAYLYEIGLDYYKNRMYSPTLGRFLQTDPIGYADNPNLYAYTGNDPVNFTDPLGLEVCTQYLNVTIWYDDKNNNRRYDPGEPVKRREVSDGPRICTSNPPVQQNVRRPAQQPSSNSKTHGLDASRKCNAVQKIAQGVADFAEKSAKDATDMALVSDLAAGVSFATGDEPGAEIAGQASLQFTAQAGAWAGISAVARFASGNYASVIVSQMSSHLVKRMAPFLPEEEREKASDLIGGNYQGSRCR